MTNARRARWIGGWVCLALIASACSSPSPSPTPTASAGIASPVPSASTPPPEAADPTAVDLIREATRRGVIDEATSYLYRLYAQWGDPRLPDEYRGVWTEDEVAVELAAEAFDRLPADETAPLTPFVVRPTDPESYWTGVAAETGSEINGGIRLAVLADDPACDGMWARTDLSTIPVTIWGLCGGPAGSRTNGLAASVAQVGTFMTQLWGPMTDLMGKPIGDEFWGGSQANDEVTEAGDGRLDVYVVNIPNASYLRNVENDALAMARSASPYRDGKSSGYMIVDPTKAASSAGLKSDLAHEFFHVLGHAHNQAGKLACPFPNPAGPCAPEDRLAHWISEASATWAEHHFVPEGRAVRNGPYSRFEYFRGSGLSLSATTDINHYASFMWPLFMEQESSRAEKAVADTWRAMEGQYGWDAIQVAVNIQLPFRDYFRDFAVRVWNEQLDGNPIDPRFQELDAKFPTTRANDGDPASRFRDEIALTLSQPTYTFSEELPDLWASYYDVSLASNIRKVTFEFVGLAPSSSLDVDALVKIGDAWERRKLPSDTVEWCLDRPQDAISQLILVLSNHNMDPNQPIRGDWTVSVSDAGCATATDTLMYAADQAYGAPSDPFYQTSHQEMSLGLSLAPAPGGTDYAIPLGNDNSTYAASYSAQSTLTTDFGTCVTQASGNGSGDVADVGDVTAWLTREADGVWTMGVSASVQIPVTVHGGDCADSYVGTQIIQLPECIGTEIQDASPTRTFQFGCTYPATGGYSWSVSGSVTVNF